MKNKNAAAGRLPQKTSGGATACSISRAITACAVSATIASSANLAQADQLDETTVLATGYAVGSEQTGLRVQVIDGDALNDSGVLRLEDAALFSPGLNIFNNGGHGTVSSIFIRGTESDQTALFIDGVKLTDSRVFPFPASNILSGAGIHPGERLEILRGPQSALHGSDAIGGVLGLSLDKGTATARNRAWLEYGSFDSINAGLRLQGRDGKLSYHSVFSWSETDNDRARNGHNSLNAALRLDYDIDDSTSIGLTFRFLEFETDIPPLGFTPFAVNQTRNTIYSAWYDAQISERWHTRLTFGGYQSDFDNTGGFGDSRVETQRHSLDWKNRLTWNKEHETTLGVSVAWLDTLNTGAAIANKKERNTSFYLQQRWAREGEFDLLAGVRHDTYDDGEDSTTFRFAAAYHATDSIQIHGSIASGFRRPSVVDLYGFFGSGGNLNLKSETSLGWDAGIRIDLSDSNHIDLTYFHNDIDDLIASGPAPTFTAMNIQRARTRGIELSHQATWLNERIKTRLAYTWLQAENLSQNARLLRRPSHTLNADINVKANECLTIGAGLTWVADREDSDAFTFARKDMDDYLTARLYTRWDVNESLSLHARIENLTNEQYSEVDGFPAHGRAIYAGLTFQW